MLKYNLNIVDGLFFEIVDAPEGKEYCVDFLERRDGKIHEIYSVNLKKAHWGKMNKKYLGDYIIEVWDKSDKTKHVLVDRISVLEYIKYKKVFITFESKSLGDTLAWMPYCLEFKKTYGCDVVVSTFMNDMFESEYPELTFVGRGETVNGIVGMFRLGWYWHGDFEPANPVTIPLQQTACNILHLPFTEIKPRMSFRPDCRPIENKYIAISTIATAGCKVWEPWQELIYALIKRGYMVYEVSKEGQPSLKGLVDIPERSTQALMNIIHHAEFFIGLGSGSSWLSWALNKQVVMIANFSQEGHEFTENTIRITNKTVCNGCWNNPNFRFERGDWNWCPIHKGTERQFECHKSITVEDVIAKVNHLL
ncbi:MAG: autotransporter strand-loop-strand O-heptosyltransferase [Cytophagia bacterium]|jgi:autotransporter strand-loop-strand O-heptosyltransferase|nr:autotransporter strand-loop-strand O-heptosyltransferase [Cytophagia bacterium]